ncbi:Pleckstrin homology domain-containing protein [Flagelloscypha sp. PMI_526]|nr:Pleckstrin homology domain-containing protein [Flagelloscypha sp. PMI_526]
MAPPLPVVRNTHASEIQDDEAECPVCLEPLSFSFRLPGEKPHISPECGHALHEACFTAVYGPPPSQTRGSLPRKTNLGVCGVCRRPMKVSTGDGSHKSNKLASLTGMGAAGTSRPTPGPNIYPGQDHYPQAPNPALARPRGNTNPSNPLDPFSDDPIETAPSVRSADPKSGYIVAPSIQVRPEFSSLSRSGDQTQPLSCIVVIELPGKRIEGAPGPVMPVPDYHQSSPNQSPSHMRRDTSQSSSPQGGNSPYMQSKTLVSGSHSQLASTTTLGASQNDFNQNADPFAAITADLRARIIDWKGHPLSDLGPLQMYDLLSVRRDNLVREFYVYLFKEALICVVEEKKRGLGRLLSNASNASDPYTTSVPQPPKDNKGVLRLKGRIYVRHIKHVTASSAAGEMSLTIDMEDELASFILIFKERGSLENWRRCIEGLVHGVRGSPPQPPPSYNGNPLSIEEFGGNAKAFRMLSGASVSTQNTTSSSGTNADSLLNGSRGSTMSSSTSHGSQFGGRGMQKLSTLGEDDEVSHYDNDLHSLRHQQSVSSHLHQHNGSPSPVSSHMGTGGDSNNWMQPHTSNGPSNSLPPLPHAPMDLILVIALPPPSATSSTAQLKIRVIKETLDFMIGSLGGNGKDRISLVTFEVGNGGRVRKTGFLAVGRSSSRLHNFVDGIKWCGDSQSGQQNEDDDQWTVKGSREEKTDVVTAVNHALDVVLQRKNKNPISGMVLVSDASDSTRRAQMDLVLARAEAANVPIHSFGFGRSHDPASLWLMSNHTAGTYTFVKDWYDLKSCVAGCVGGMMSIGLSHIKVHVRVVDAGRWRIRKVSGGPGSILSREGTDCDVEIPELRYGERKEMLIEMELDNGDFMRQAAQDRSQQEGLMRSGKGLVMMGGGGRGMNASDQFMQSMGLDALAIDDTGGDLMDGMMDRMIDEVPVIEVDGSYHDPKANKQVARLAHPVLLTVTLLPQSQMSVPKPTTSDPIIVRRRMELLASDMITRALVLVSRRNFPQAQKIMSETRRILHTVLATVSKSLPPPSADGIGGIAVRNRKELLTLSAVRSMQAILTDLGLLMEALEENMDLFAHDQRNFGAQQAMILRDQKSWTGRSATERMFWTVDNSIELVSRSTDWVSRD